MLRTLGRALAKGYYFLLSVAAGGFVGANLAGVVRGAWTFNAQHAPDPAITRAWMHGGWIVGAALFFAAGVAHHLRSGLSGRSEADGGKDGTRTRKKVKEAMSSSFNVTINGRPAGILGSIGVGAAGGALLGLLLGGNLLLLWFSVAYSPFAPGGWASSISTEQIHIDSSVRERPVAATSHPVALYALFGPIVIGATSFALICGIGTTVQKLRKLGQREPGPD
jgi:hypothetical protein